MCEHRRVRRGRPRRAQAWWGLGAVASLSLAALIAPGSALAQSEVTDEFERRDRGPWQVHIGDVGIVAASDLGLLSGPEPPQTAIGIASWSGSAVGADQFSEVTVSADLAAEMLVQAYARRRASDAARYGFHYAADPGVSPEWQLKYDGVPTAQTRILARAPAPPLRPGDTIRIEVRGTDPVRLAGYHNGVSVLSATDSARSAIHGGPPGVAFRLMIGSTTRFPTPVVERWRGGDLAAPAPTPPASTAPTSPPAPPPPVTGAPGAPAPGGPPAPPTTPVPPTTGTPASSPATSLPVTSPSTPTTAAPTSAASSAARSAPNGARAARAEAGEGGGGGLAFALGGAAVVAATGAAVLLRRRGR